MKQKGTRKCKNPECRREFRQTNSMQPYCSNKCKVEHQTALGMKIVQKNRSAALRERKEETAQMKIDLMSYSEMASYVQEHSYWGINRLIREIDKGWPCISSGATDCQFHAGHFWTVGGQSYIRFHLMNIWLQSAQDNNFNSANINGYRAGIVNTFGQDIMYEIDGLKQKYCDWKIMKIDLIEAIPRIKECTREAKKLPKLSAKARIEVRRQYNKRIGLYDLD